MAKITTSFTPHTLLLQAVHFTHLYVRSWALYRDEHVFIDLYPVIILIGMYGCVVLPPQVFPLSGLLPL